MALHKHLSLEEHFFIAKQLNNNTSFKSIALELDRDRTTISKEVRAHKILKKTGAHSRAFNNCFYAITATHGDCAVFVTADGIAGLAKHVLLSARILWRRNALVFPSRLLS